MIHSNAFGTVCLVCWVNISIVLILPRKLAVIHIGREHDLFQNASLAKIDLSGKKLFACKSAVKDFKNILKTVGGVKEQERAR